MSRHSGVGQMTLHLTCLRSDPGSVKGFTVTIRNGTSNAASIVASEIFGDGTEYAAPGLVLRLKRAGSAELENFRYRPQGRRRGGGTGTVSGRIVLGAPRESQQWWIDSLRLASSRSQEAFRSSEERGELHAVFESENNISRQFPRLWTGRIESNGVLIPNDCK